MIVDWTLSVSGGLKEHLLRIEFDFELGRSVPRCFDHDDPGFSDPGEPGAAAVRRAWIIVEKDGRAVKERPLRAATVMKLKEDDRLGELLYKSAVEEMPHD